MQGQVSIDRRSLIAGIAAAIGAASLPSEALAAPAHSSVSRFLTQPQFALLGAVADTIMPATDTPGALAAQVPARLDVLLLNWASAQTRTEIVDALERIDAAAKVQAQKGFAALAAADRLAILRPHDAAALKTTPLPPGSPRLGLLAPSVSYADAGYHKLKDLVLSLYYYSEAAATSELIYEHVPGKFEPSIKVTPQSRPYLGIGGL